MKVNFTGHSDDIFSWRSELNSGDETTVDTADVARFKLHSKSQDAGLMVYGIYADGGVWAVGVGQIEEDKLLPDWPISITNGHAYSAQLVIDAPDDVVITASEEAAHAS